MTCYILISLFFLLTDQKHQVVQKLPLDKVIEHLKGMDTYT